MNARTMLRCSLALSTTFITASACTDDIAAAPELESPTSAEVPTAVEQPPLLEGLDLGGRYEVAATWNLSAPLGGGRTIGVVASELMMEMLVDNSGVPGFLEADSYEALDELVGAQLAAAIDDQMPPGLAPDSNLMQELGAVLASVDVQSHLEIEGTSEGFEGTEELVGITVVHEGVTHGIGYDELLVRHDHSLAGVPVPTLVMEWEGAGTSDGRIEVEPHSMELYYGELVLWILGDVMGAEITAPSLAPSLACVPLTGALTESEGLSLTVGGYEIDLDPDAIHDACMDADEQLGQYALGLFSLDARATVGGTVWLEDETGDRVVDAMLSRDYGGHVLVGKRATSPRLSVSFVAERL